MKEYVISVSDKISLFYENIAKITDRKIEEILSDTLHKTTDKIVQAVPHEEK